MTPQKALICIFGIAVAYLLLFQSSGATTFIISADKTNNIQNTIDKARDGDRIIIKSGTYRGNVNVTKSLILRGLDTGRGKPILNAAEKQSAITIFADGVWLEGFELINSGSSRDDAGIKILSKNNLVKGNVATNNSHGIYLGPPSSNNTIINNLARANYVGISMTGSCSNNINGNTVRNNSFAGVFLAEARDNTVIGNLILKNAWVGILLSNSSSNRLEGNYAEGNRDEGIWLLNSRANLLQSNSAVNNLIFGILLVQSSNNTITGSRASGNLDGLSLESSRNNSIYRNYISDNAFGIYVDSSDSNSIYLNNFLNNTDSAHSNNSSSWWSSPTFLPYEYRGLLSWGYLGNFWDDHFTADVSGSGVGSQPYRQGSAGDQYPLVSRAENYAVITE